METKRLAAAYIRRSVAPGEGSRSLTQQRKWAQEAAERRGYVLPETYILEEVVSGWKPGVKRPGRDRLIELITTGQVRAVLVWAVDRLGRNLAETSAIFQQCRE